VALTLEEEFGLLDAAWSTVAQIEGEMAALMFLDSDGELAVVTFRENADDPARTAMAAAATQTLTIMGERHLQPDWIAYAGVAYVGVKRIGDVDLDTVVKGDMEQAYKDGDPDVSEQLVIVRVGLDGTWMQRFRLPLHEPDGKPWGPHGMIGGALDPIMMGLFTASQIIAAVWDEA
jgi:hypothetical protein